MLSSDRGERRRGRGAGEHGGVDDVGERPASGLFVDKLAANLVSTVRDGQRKLHYLNPVPLQEIQTRWIWKFGESRLAALRAMKTRAERTAMTGTSVTSVTTAPDYVYATYIRATPEQVWVALTDQDTTARF